MAANNSNQGSSIVIGLLGIAFVVLKLCGVINWSWWWVTLPFWGGLALIAAIALIAGIIALIAKALA